MNWLLFGSVLSPFSVKLRATCRWMEIPIRWLPQDGTLRDNLEVQALRLAFGRGLVGPSAPAPSELDDAPPLVPYLFGPHGVALQDSSAALRWLDTHVSTQASIRLGDPRAAFVADLVEEAIDEWGLYLLHHHRWVVSAARTRYDVVIEEEFGRWLPRGVFERARDRFAARQVRRLPYLGSVAPVHPIRTELQPDRRPPSRPGFPATHGLLDSGLAELMTGLDLLLADRPWLLGAGPTAADLALCGMLGSQREVDPVAAEAIAARRPLNRWLDRALGADGVDKGEVSRETPRPLDTLDRLGPSLVSSFVALMAANERAYEVERSSGATCFNEAAFDRGQALFEVSLPGGPFRTVVKSFQVRVWRELRRSWRRLTELDRGALREVCPTLSTLDVRTRPDSGH